MAWVVAAFVVAGLLMLTAAVAGFFVWRRASHDHVQMEHVRYHPQFNDGVYEEQRRQWLEKQ